MPFVEQLHVFTEEDMQELRRLMVIKLLDPASLMTKEIRMWLDQMEAKYTTNALKAAANAVSN